MLSTRAEVTIDRPITDIYEFMADFRNNPTWCPVELEVRQLDGNGRVQRYENKVKPGPRVLTNLYEVIREDPPRKLTFHGSNDMAEFHGSYELEETAGGTRVVTVSNLQWRGRVMRLLNPLMRPIGRSNAAKQVRLLKEQLEEAASGDRR